MNFGFSIVFLQFGLGGAGVQIAEDAHFFERYCDESIFT